MTDPSLLRPAEAARRIGVSPSTLRYWATRKGYIAPVTLPDGSWRYRAEDVAWLREQVRRNVESR